MRLRRTRSAVVVALPFLLASCASVSGESDPFSGGVPKEVKVYVTNLAFMDATLWGVTTGTRQKLGIATGKREHVFTMPMPFPTQMHIEIDILAGPLCYTERLTVDPGDELELIIQNENANWNCVRR